MSKIQLALQSRTFWTIVITIVLNTIAANSSLIPAGIMDLLNPILGLLATYFHVNPSQVYTQ